MKRYKNIYLALLASLALASCDDKVADDTMPVQFIPKGEVVYDDSFENLYIDSDGETIIFPFTTNDEWKILSTRDWLTFEGESDGELGENFVTINIDKSYEDADREASITFVVEKLRQSIVVMQQRARMAYPDKSDYGVLASSGEEDLEVSINYNMAFDVEIDGGEYSGWLTLDGYSCVEQDDVFVYSIDAPASGAAELLTLNFLAEKSEEYNPMDATVTLRIKDYPNSTESFTVAQEIGIMPIEFDDSYTVEVDATENILALEFDAEIPFSASSSVSWIYITEQPSFDNGRLTIYCTIRENSDLDNTRDSYIRLYNTDEMVERTIKIVQEECNIDLEIADLNSAGDVSNRLTILSATEDLSSYTRVYISGDASLSSADISAIETMLPSVKSIDISNTKTTDIAASQFSGNSTIQYVILPNTLTSIGSSAFATSGLVSIDIPESVESIGDTCFSGCSSLTSVTLNEGIEHIGYRAFYQSAIESIHLPSTINSWGVQNESSLVSQAFIYCTSLRTVTMAEGLSCIYPRAFIYSGVESVTLYGGVDWVISGTLGTNQAFYGCSELATVEVLSSEDDSYSLEGSIFESCTGLASITLHTNTPPSIGSGGFGSSIGSLVTGGTIVYIPEAAEDTYLGNYLWNRFNIEAY